MLAHDGPNQNLPKCEAENVSRAIDKTRYANEASAGDKVELDRENRRGCRSKQVCPPAVLPMVSTRCRLGCSPDISVGCAEGRSTHAILYVTLLVVFWDGGLF